jgi:glycosyltransferase involved in cell wall biosynthesis
MRIAQIAPLAESVPPQLYGGTERVVASLTNELVRRGHDVTLFASGDSQTLARLVPVVPRSLRLSGVTDCAPAQIRQLDMVFGRADEFDIIHSHVDFQALPFGRFVETPVVHTLHGRLDLPEIQPVYAHFDDAPLVSISDNQRRLLQHWNWIGTVYNGLELGEYGYHPNSGNYLAFLGRISPEKGIEQAIAVAQSTGLPLKIAAKIDPTNADYYEERVKPLLHNSLIEYVGEITEQEKDIFLGHAMALLFPIDWPEPFGLVMVEAMATGCPVIASRRGSVPEVLVDGVTGYVCDSVETMALACSRVEQLDRSACRERAMERFSATQMTDGYEAVYRRLRGSQVTPQLSSLRAAPTIDVARREESMANARS